MKWGIICFDELCECLNCATAREGEVFVLNGFISREEDQCRVSLNAEVVACLRFNSAINLANVHQILLKAELNPGRSEFLAVATPGRIELYEPSLVTDCGLTVPNCGWEVDIVQIDHMWHDLRDEDCDWD